MLSLKNLFLVNKVRLSLYGVGVFSILTSLMTVPIWAMQFKVSQIGYHTNGQKIAFLEDVPENEIPKVIVFDPKWKDKLEIFNGRKVYEGAKLIPLQSDNPSPGLKSYLVDFSGFATNGEYELRVSGHPDVKSLSMNISEYLYWDILRPIIKTFYFQRSGQTLEDYRRNFHYYDCYTDDDLRIKSQNAFGENVWDASGGWYDDGGFDKHITKNAAAAAELLALYESNPSAFQRFKMDYPANENSLSPIPDLLNESKIGLNWLMTMQRQNGSVFGGVKGNAGKCESRESFDLNERQVIETSPQDTAITAATLAMAGRVYRQKDIGYAIKSLRAAEDAWEYLETQPVQGNDELLPRFWAAVELSITTGKAKYQQYVQKSFKGLPIQKSMLQHSPMLLRVWQDYAFYTKMPQPEIISAIRRQFLAEADSIAQSIEENPMTGGLTQFNPDSNQLLTSRLEVLMAAYRLAPSIDIQGRYQKAANQGALYLFGLNPLGRSFISGVGTDPIRHITMQRFSADVLQGYLVAGPNSHANDGITPKDMGFFSYADDPNAKSVNQISLQKAASLALALGQLNTSYNYPSLNPLAQKTPTTPDKNTKKKSKYPSLN